MPVAIALASISLIAVDVTLALVGTVRSWRALRAGRLTIGYGCVVAIAPLIASTAGGRPRFTGLLTVVGTGVSGALGALAKFQARGRR